jgi:hypothetical protein
VIIAIKEEEYERALSMIYAGEDEEGTPIDVNAKDADGLSALMYACVADQPNIVRALLEAGAEMRVCGLPLEHLSQRTQAALRVGFCATFATESLHWWMAPRIERIMRCPSPIGELVLGYTGRMAAFPEDMDSTDPPTLAFRLAPTLGVDGTPFSSSSSSSSSPPPSSSSSSSSSSLPSSSSSSLSSGVSSPERDQKGQKRTRPEATKSGQKNATDI